MDALIPANVIIGDRNYRIKIEPGKEEIVRRTVKQINDKIIAFKTQFAGKDMQDYIAMVILWYATNIQEKDAPSSLPGELAPALKALDDMLEKALETTAG